MKCYTIIPRVSGYIRDWIKLVPKISELGFDTIHLLPITQMGASLSPYASKNPYTIDPMFDHLGSSERALRQFKQFIRVLKHYNMRLCVDIVLNHLSFDHPLLHSNKKWTFEDPSEIDGMKRAGWHDGKNWHKWSDLVLLNYDNNIDISLWTYMFNYVLFWAELAAETNGLLRLDNLHSSNKSFTEYVLSQIKIQYPQVEFFSELFSDQDTIRMLIEKYNFTYLLATLWEHKFARELEDYINYLHSANFSVRFFTPVLTHDTESITQEFGSIKSTIPRLVVSALMGSGDWGIVQGLEYGIPNKIEFIGKQAPISWYTEYKFTPALYNEIIKKLNLFIDTYSFFREKANLGLIGDGHEAVITALRYPKERKKNNLCKEYALVITNLDINYSHSITIEESILLQDRFYFPMKYIDKLTDKVHETTYVANQNQRKCILFLEPGECLVLMCA